MHDCEFHVRKDRDACRVEMHAALAPNNYVCSYRLRIDVRFIINIHESMDY